MADSETSTMDKDSLDLVEKALQESLGSNKEPPKTFGEAESTFVENALERSLQDENYYREFIKDPTDIVNNSFFQTIRSKLSNIFSSEPIPVKENKEDSNPLSGWARLRQVTILHSDAGQISSLNADLKVYVESVKDGKAFISKPKEGWVNESSVMFEKEKSSNSFLQRVIQKFSQSANKNEKERYRVVGEQGVIVRKSYELSSETVGHLPLNSVIMVSAVRGRRAFVTHPITGWCSIKSERGTLFLERTNKSEIEQNRFYIEALRHKISIAKTTNAFLEENMGDSEINDMIEHMQFSKTLIRNEATEKRKLLLNSLGYLRGEVEKRQSTIHGLFQKIETLRLTMDDS